MTCKIAIGEGYDPKNGKLAIKADMHRPRECRLIGLRGVSVATVQDCVATGPAGITGRQHVVVPPVQQPGAIQSDS